MAGKKKMKQKTMQKIKQPLSSAVVGGSIACISAILFSMLLYVAWTDMQSDASSTYDSTTDQALIDLDQNYGSEGEKGEEYYDKRNEIMDDGKEENRMDGKYSFVLGPIELSWIDYIVFAIIVLIGPFSFWKVREMDRLNRMEEKFPDFLRDLAQFWKGGLSMNVAVETLSEGEYGALNEEVKTMSRQLSWGISFNEVLRMFVERTRTGLIERSISLVEEANKAGGKITDIILSVSNDAREIKTLQRERDDTMASYVGVVRTAWLIYMLIIFIMVSMFLPSIAEETREITGEEGGGSMGSVTINEMDTFYVTLIFFMSVIVQAMGGGINAGVFGKGSFAVGMKYATQLSLVGWAFFEISAVKMGLQAGG